MSDSLNFNYNEFQANQKMNLYGSKNRIDYSFIKNNSSDDTKKIEDDKFTKIKNSSEFLSEIRKTKQSNVTLSNTLSGFSSLTSKADIGDDINAQAGARTVLKVVSEIGGKEGLDEFTSSASNLSSEQLNKMFTQSNEVSSLGATKENLSKYISAVTNIDNIGDSETTDSFFKSIDSIVSLDFSKQASESYGTVEKNKLPSDYKIETLNKFVDAINSISKLDFTDTEKQVGIGSIIETVVNSTAENISDNIQKSIDSTFEV